MYNEGDIVIIEMNVENSDGEVIAYSGRKMEVIWCKSKYVCLKDDYYGSITIPVYATRLY